MATLRRTPSTAYHIPTTGMRVTAHSPQLAIHVVVETIHVL
jgi:hypothetical protein